MTTKSASMAFCFFLLLAIGFAFQVPSTGGLLARIAGGCIAAGHINGCCQRSNTACVGRSRSCYCDQQCFARDDCCLDINLTRCRPSPCFAAGLSPGCCSLLPFNLCRTSTGCYCDRACHRFGDCCDGVQSPATCSNLVSSLQQRPPLYPSQYPKKVDAYAGRPIEALLRNIHSQRSSTDQQVEARIMERMLLETLMKDAAQYPISSQSSNPDEAEDIKKLTELYMKGDSKKFTRE